MYWKMLVITVLRQTFGHDAPALAVDVRVFDEIRCGGAVREEVAFDPQVDAHRKQVLEAAPAAGPSFEGALEHVLGMVERALLLLVREFLELEKLRFTFGAGVLGLGCGFGGCHGGDCCGCFGCFSCGGRGCFGRGCFGRGCCGRGCLAFTVDGWALRHQGVEMLAEDGGDGVHGGTPPVGGEGRSVAEGLAQRADGASLVGRPPGVVWERCGVPRLDERARTAVHELAEQVGGVGGCGRRSALREVRQVGEEGRFALFGPEGLRGCHGAVRVGGSGVSEG
jgi:hypothetical protein